MKKFLLAAAFVTVCSFSSAVAQTAVQSSVQTEKAATVNDAVQTEAKEKTAPKAAAASCCSKKSKDAKACADKKEAKSAAGKSSCCQKGHTEAKAEEKDHAGHKH